MQTLTETARLKRKIAELEHEKKKVYKEFLEILKLSPSSLNQAIKSGLFEKINI